MKAAYERPRVGGTASRMLDAGSKNVGFRKSGGGLWRSRGGAGLGGRAVGGSGVEVGEDGQSEKAREGGTAWEGAQSVEVDPRGRSADRSGYRELIR